MAKSERDQTRPESSPKLALLGAAGRLNLATHLRAAGALVLDAEPPPKATSPALLQDYAFQTLSARTGELGALSALLQALTTATTGKPPKNWLWQRQDGRYLDGLRPRLEPEGVADPDELAFLRQAHQRALIQMLAEADEVLLMLTAETAMVDAADGAAYAFAPGPDITLPKGARLSPAEPTLEMLHADFLALHHQLLAINPRLLLRLGLHVAPARSGAHFADDLPVLRRQSDLRVMMAHWAATLPQVDYLPLWELCTGQLTRSGQFLPATAELAGEGGPLAAALILGTDVAVAAASGAPMGQAASPPEDKAAKKARRAERRAARGVARDTPQKVICEEELLEAFSK